ncbi:MAG: PilW family protein [Xanthomonadales bacterium]|nr:PilW family protein [Xanthomonadales bacterium]
MLIDCKAPKIDICVQNASGNAAVLNCSGSSNTRPNSDSWNPVYQDNLDLYWPQVVYYFVGQSASGDQPALFRAANCYGSGGGDACVLEELAEGLETLQAFYSVEGSDTLYAGDSLPGNDWNAVRSVSLHLLLAAPGPGDSRSIEQAYSLDTLNLETDDEVMRQPYSSAVAIRNKIEVR